MSQEVQQKIDKFESFVEDVLKVDLSDLEKKLSDLAAEVSKWKDVKRAALMFRVYSDRVENNLTVLSQLYEYEEYEVHAKAEITDLSTLIVNIGCDCLLEMDLEEASKYADIRIRVLEKQIEHYRQLAVGVKVNIKLTLLAINELGPNEK